MAGGDPRRAERVAEGIRTEVATFLRSGAKDPRLRGLVTVTGVDVTRDLRHAKVFVSVMGSDEERAATYQGLASVAHHLRGTIGRALRLRVAPEIEFKADDSIAHAARIDALLEQVRREGVARDVDESAAPDGPSEGDGDTSEA
jgi:ribosome-binding factor A